MNEHATVGFEANEYAKVLASQIGFATQLSLQCPRKSFRIAAIAAWVWPPVQLGQIEFCFNFRGSAVAYATWAHVSDEVAAELRKGDSRILHLSEWNEGDNLWIMDVVAPFGDARAIARQLRERLGCFDRVRGVRYNPDGSIRRLVDHLIGHAS